MFNLMKSPLEILNYTVKNWASGLVPAMFFNKGDDNNWKRFSNWISGNSFHFDISSRRVYYSNVILVLHGKIKDLMRRN